jgi:hypothetical protein
MIVAARLADYLWILGSGRNNFAPRIGPSRSNCSQDGLSGGEPEAGSVIEEWSCLFLSTSDTDLDAE